MRIVVTGAAGFIGANLVKALNRRGVREIVAVDNLAHADKFANLVDCEIDEFVDKDEFLRALPTATSTTTSRPSCTRARARTRWKPTAAT